MSESGVSRPAWGAELSSLEAAEIIERMGSLGLPPERGIEYVSVGLDRLLSVLERYYLEPMAQGERGSAFKLIKGSFGAGKTHFLTCLRNLAWGRGFLTANVELSLQGCSFGDLASVYQALVQNLVTPPAKASDYEGRRGLGTILRAWAYAIEDPGAQRQWLRNLKLATMANHNFRLVAAHFMQSLWAEDEESAEQDELWLLGGTVKRLKLGSLTLTESICERNGSSMLTSLVQLLRLCGYPGIVALFDEADRVAAGGRREKKKLVDNLRQFVDMCGSGRLPGLFWALAVPPEFISQVVVDYPALQQRLHSPLPFSAVCPQAPTIDVTDSSLPPRQFFYQLGERILAVASRAWDWQPQRERQLENLRFLVEEYLTLNFDAGQRRNFVKQWIAVLTNEHLHGEGTTDIEALCRQDEGLGGEEEEFADF